MGMVNSKNSNVEPTLFVYVLYQMSPLNYKRTSKSLAPFRCYLGKKLAIKREKAPHSEAGPG